MVLEHPQPRSSRYTPYSRLVSARDQLPEATSVTSKYKLCSAQEFQSLFTPSDASFKPVSTTSLRAARAATGYHDRQAAASWRTIGLHHLGYFSIIDAKPTTDRAYQFVWDSREDTVSDSPTFETIIDPPAIIRNASVIEPNDDSSPYTHRSLATMPNFDPNFYQSRTPDDSPIIEPGHDSSLSAPKSSPSVPMYDLLSTADDSPTIEPDHNSSLSTPQSSSILPIYDLPSTAHDSPTIGPDHNSPVPDLKSLPIASALHMSPVIEPVHDSPTLLHIHGSQARKIKDNSVGITSTRRVSSRLRAQKTSLGSTGLPSRVVFSILRKAYARVVRPQLREIIKCKATRLDETYGELMPSLIEELLAIVKLDSNSLCIDLGSGTGTVVLQMAMRTGCRSVGIECVETRARVAQEQFEEVKRLLGEKARRMGAVDLLKGDMRKNQMLQELIGKADLVFVNNLKFDPTLNHSIANMLLKLKVGAYVMSLEEIDVSLRESKASARDEDSLGSKMSISEREYAENGVSWKHTGGRYLLHVMLGNK